MFPNRATAVLLLAFVPAVAAHAATVCTGSSTSLNLGAYIGDTGAPTDSIGSFALACTRNGGPQNITVTMAIGPSANSGSIPLRQLRLATGTDLLAYNLYGDATRATVWGDTAGVNTQSRAVSIPNKTTLNVTFNIYGRIPGLQNVRAGAYSDTLVVTISY